MSAPRKRAIAPKTTPKAASKKSSAAKPPLAPQRYSWRKLSAAKWADSWLERLSFLGPTRVMIIEFPNAPKVRVEAHGLKKRRATNS